MSNTNHSVVRRTRRARPWLPAAATGRAAAFLIAAATVVVTPGAARAAEPPRPAAAPATAAATAAAAVVLKRQTLTDPGMGNMESHTVLVPAGWKAEGGGWWPGANYFNVLPSQDVKVTAPDGRIVRVGPSLGATDIRPAPHLGVPRPAEGRAEGGYPVLYMPEGPDQWKQWLEEKGLARSYPNAKNIRVKQLVVIPELTTLLQRQLEPIKQFQAEQNRQSRAIGLNTRSYLDSVVYGATCTYEEDGRPWEHLFIFGATYLGMDSQVGRQLWWGIEPNVSFRAPAGQLEANLPLMMTIAQSVQPTPRWQQMRADHMRKMNQIAAKGAADRSRILAESNREINKIITEGYQQRQASQDETHRKVINSIRGVEEYTAPGGGDGTRVQLPNTYQHVYGDGNGEYILTNDANYNPNTDPATNHRTWNTLEVAK